MSTTDFDPDAFMNETIDQPLETDLKLCPPGEYQATIQDFDATALENIEFTYKKGKRAGEDGSMQIFTCPWVISDPRAVAAVGRTDFTTVRQRINLDIDSQTRKLDWGINKNLDLGNVRKAVGQNNPGPWNIGQLRGAGPAIVKVVHKQITTKDGREMTVAEVARATPIR